VDFVNEGGGCRTSLKVLKVEVKVILKCISIKFMLKTNRERSERRKK